MSGSEPVNQSIILQVGHSTDTAESFLDGRATVVSRNGLVSEERAIFPHLPIGKTGSALVVNPRYGVSAAALAALNPDMKVRAFFDDAWFERNARDTLGPLGLPNLNIELAADPTIEKYDVVILPFDMQGITDLIRERVRLAATLWLKKGGLLIASTDNPRDKFLGEEVRKSFGGAHRAPTEDKRPGIAYVVRKKKTAEVNPPHGATQYLLREGEHNITITSRLGVFCHDHLDDGTRALLAVAQIADARRILDLGCGCGVVGLVAASRAPGAHVTFLDSNARAIESARTNAEAHGIADRSDFILSADPSDGLEGKERFDCILTNPPYYGNGRIAIAFWNAATHYAAPEGDLWLVTKDAEWHRQQCPDREWVESESTRLGGYDILHFVRTTGT